MLRILILFYSLLYTLAILVYLPFRLIRSLIRGEKTDISARLWKLPTVEPSPGQCPTLWIHAVSVGEVNAARTLVNRLSLLHYNLFISTITQTGREQAGRLFGQQALIFYLPLDWQLLCRRLLKRIRPDAILLMETEIWPNFITAAARLRIPVLLVNGRISDASFRSYNRVRFFLKRFLTLMAHFCMQSQQDAERIVVLGAPVERVSQTGNLKYDYSLSGTPDKDDLKRAVSRVFKNSNDSLLLVCGSTKPGEEKLLAPVLSRIWKEFPSFKLLIAPRHPHRGDEIVQLLGDWDVRCLQRSKHGLETETAGEAQALVLDSIGELAHLYELADLVYMGGSLVPTGGQNPIEAAAFGKPILFGPDMSNFREIARTFLQAEAAIQVTSPEELETQVKRLLRNPRLRERLGRNAVAVIRRNQGSVDRTIEIVKQCLHGNDGEQCSF
jgi:3-deoxy-D-manno-octulosonic-acid transferase